MFTFNVKGYIVLPNHHHSMSISFRVSITVNFEGKKACSLEMTVMQASSYIPEHLKVTNTLVNPSHVNMSLH